MVTEVKAKTEVWLCSGVDKAYRVASWHVTYAECDTLEEARQILTQLLLADRTLVERSYREAVWTA